jgi:hypothetical protein
MAYNDDLMQKRACDIYVFAIKYYESGRHDRSWRWVWRHRVEPEYHISYSTFKKYLKIAKRNEKIYLILQK